MLAYKLPEHAEGACEKFGIEVHLGYKENINDVINQFLKSNK